MREQTKAMALAIKNMYDWQLWNDTLFLIYVWTSLALKMHDPFFGFMKF